MNFGRVLAATIVASPMILFSSRTGTATFFRCIPIKVETISIPASALISSTATGYLNPLYAAVAREPPAFG